MLLFLSQVIFSHLLRDIACPFGRPGQNPGGEAVTQRNLIKKLKLLKALEHTFFSSCIDNSWVTALPSMCQKQYPSPWKVLQHQVKHGETISSLSPFSRWLPDLFQGGFQTFFKVLGLPDFQGARDSFFKEAARNSFFKDIARDSFFKVAPF